MTTGQAPALAPISMQEAVGYSTLECQNGAQVEGRLVLKNERIFLLVNAHGDIGPTGHCGLGFFLDDTRMLSEYVLRMQGEPPTLLSSQLDHRQMASGQIDLAISDTAFGGDPWNVSNVVHIRRALLLDDRLTERLRITSYLARPTDYWLELSFGCDFADIFEVRGWKRAERGTFYEPLVSSQAVRFRYRGRDGKLIRSEIAFRAPPNALDARRARWLLRLEPQQPVEIEWQVLPDAVLGATWEDRAPAVLPLEDRRAAVEAQYQAWRAQSARYTTDVEVFNNALSRAETDLRALYIEAGGEPIISAGIPWYSTAFGRDAIIASLQTLGLNPVIATDTLRYLAAHQGRRENAATEEQPGKIMHEIRRGELARAGEIPHTPYYGSVDATPLWLVLLHETWRWTGDAALVRELLPAADLALKWIECYGDLDGDGLVEYAGQSPKGLVNQGWKDSWDGVPFPDGTLPRPPIALVEVQGYVFDAKRRMAALYDAFGQEDRAQTLRQEATELRRRIVDRFWLEDLGTFALALDGDKVPLPTVTTNAGHLLWSRVPDRAQAARMAPLFLSPEMFSGWGVRTLSSAHRVYNPMSYHNGSVWPHDNGIVALGLALYDRTPDALRVLTAMFEAAAGMQYHRLPELYCGMRRAHGGHPVLYPVSNSPQAWASGAFFMLLQAVTGILPDAPAGLLHIRDPLLPDFLQRLVVEGLRIGESRVALQFTRHGGRTLANVLDVQGQALQVRIELT